MPAMQQDNEEMKRLLASRFRKLNDPTHAWGDVTSLALALPGLVGYWPGVVGLSTTLIDVSGNGLAMTRMGDANVGTYGLAPVLNFDGTGDYFTRADDAKLDILGTETIINSGIRGLTVMCWVFKTATGTTGFLDKWTATGNQRAYSLRSNVSSQTAFFVSSNGTASTSVTMTTTTPINQWVFVGGRFRPSTQLKVWENLNTNTNVTSIPAAIVNSTSPFVVGATDGGTLNPITGSIAFPVLCAAALSDEAIETFAAMTSPLFGVRI